MDHNDHHYHRDIYLNRSFSAPEFNRSGYPIHRKFYIREIVQDLNTNTTLVRTISSQQTYGFLPVINDAGSDRCKDVTLTNNSNELNDTKCEETPMEVDSSSDRLQTDKCHLRQRNVRASDPNNETKTVLMPVSEPANSRCFIFLLILIGIFSLLGIYTVLFGDRFVYINRNFQFDNIKTDLEQNVLQQKRAVTAVVDSFESITDWRDRIKILPFIGNTGVGKTFVANIVKKHFYPPFVHELGALHLKDESKKRAIIKVLNVCCCNLIIIDDLKASDVKSVVGFLRQLPRSHMVMVIPIFNVQETIDGFPSYGVDEDGYRIIRDELEDSGFYYELVLFEEIEEKVIREWLRAELHKKQVDSNRHDHLIRFLLTGDHAKYKGFKELSSKLVLMLGGDPKSSQ